MSGDKIFKRALFGGFKRKSVIDYIDELQSENVKTAKKADTLESENRLLAEQLKRSREEKDRILSGAMASVVVPSHRADGGFSAAGHLSLQELGIDSGSADSPDDIDQDNNISAPESAEPSDTSGSDSGASLTVAAPIPTASAMSKFDLFSAQILANPVMPSVPAEEKPACVVEEIPDSVEESTAEVTPTPAVEAPVEVASDVPDEAGVSAPVPTASAMSKFDLFSAQILGNPVIPSAPVEEKPVDEKFSESAQAPAVQSDVPAEQSSEDTGVEVGVPIPTASAMSKFDLFSAQILGNPVINSSPTDAVRSQSDASAQDEPDEEPAPDEQENVEVSQTDTDSEIGSGDILLAAKQKIENLMSRIYEVGDMPFSFDSAASALTSEQDVSPEQKAPEIPQMQGVISFDADSPDPEAPGESPAESPAEVASPAPFTPAERSRVKANAVPAKPISGVSAVRRHPRDAVRTVKAVRRVSEDVKYTPEAEPAQPDIESLIDFFSSAELRK